MSAHRARFILMGGGLAALAVLLWPYIGKAETPASSIKLGTSCITSECHADLRKPAYLHGPLNLSQCAPCHVPVNNQHVFQKPAKGAKPVCLTCHETEPRKKVVHPPYDTECQLCHDPHGSDNRYFVKGGLGVAGCLRCHSDVRKGLNYLHGPVALGECLACHSPHQSDYKGLLTDSRTALCESCHVDIQSQMQNAVSVHEPAKKDCSQCHSAHGGNLKYFLPAPGRELCRTCHKDFLGQIEQFKHPHQVMSEGKACDSCHAPHSANQDRLLKEPNLPLCLTCHDKPIKAGDRTIADIASQIKGAKYLHGPLRENNCIACHKAHGSDFPYILDKSFPAGFYSTYTKNAYDLCFECHDKAIVSDEKSRATAFRNGDENLHYLHVNRDKGRSCHACHDEHASSQPHHIRTGVEFGKWLMRLEYTPAPNGGACLTGCHSLYKYDRLKPAENKKAPKP